jgi:hypothetical protein
MENEGPEGVTNCTATLMFVEPSSNQTTACEFPTASEEAGALLRSALDLLARRPSRRLREGIKVGCFNWLVGHSLSG